MAPLLLDACNHFRILKSTSAEPYKPAVLRSPDDPIPFVILAKPRTGSNLLVNLLDQQPRIRSGGEAVNVKHVCAKWPLNWTVAERDANRTHFIDRLLSEKAWWPPGTASRQ